jgi:hypothetical protein
MGWLPPNNHKAVSGVARLQDVKELGMAGPGETLGSPSPCHTPLLRSCCFTFLGGRNVDKDETYIVTSTGCYFLTLETKRGFFFNQFLNIFILFSKLIGGRTPQYL